MIWEPTFSSYLFITGQSLIKADVGLQKGTQEKFEKRMTAAETGNENSFITLSCCFGIIYKNVC